jgi:agmatinase
MDDERFGPPWNFLGLPDELAAPDRARAWVLPIPYESTTSYGAGTRNGPAAIIAASRQVELFDREFDCEPSGGIGFHTLPPVGLVHRSPEAMVESIRTAVAGIRAGSPRPKLLMVLGGEHSVSPGVARGLAASAQKEDLVCVQIDAHADLRESYEESPNSHACAARRILEVCPVFQIAIRNISEGEERFRRGCDAVTTYFAEDVHADPAGMLEALAGFVKGKSVFLTIDLDGLDPSIMPAVGTPEPGGIGWELTLEVARTICRQAARVPAFDIVELAPIPGMIGPDFLAAKLAYKIASLALHMPVA